MNNVALIGRITKDPEVRYTAGNEPMAVAKFSIAINRPTKGENKADFPNIVCFGRLAENVEKWCSKGSRVGITGRIQTGSYENKEGKKVYTTEVLANNVEFLNPKSEAKQKETEADVPEGFAAIEDEDIPF